MQEWLYKATPKKISFEATRDLAVDDGFICRTAFETGGARADHTQSVDFGDIIHMYFTGSGEPRVVGTFEVIGPARHAHPEWFGRTVKKTRLLEVKDAAFADRLKGLAGGEEGYAPDPAEGVMLGWAVRHRPEQKTPGYSAKSFPGRSTLVRRLTQ